MDGDHEFSFSLSKSQCNRECNIILRFFIQKILFCKIFSFYSNLKVSLSTFRQIYLSRILHYFRFVFRMHTSWVRASGDGVLYTYSVYTLRTTIHFELGWEVYKEIILRLVYVWCIQWLGHPFLNHGPTVVRGRGASLHEKKKIE